MPTTSVSSRSVQALRPCPWRMVCTRRPTVIASPAAAWARASAVTAILALAGTTKVMRMLVQPPQRRAIQKAFIKDHLVQPCLALQIQARLGDQRPRPQRLMLLNRPHFDRQRHLGRGIDQQEHLPAVDGDLDLVHLPPLIFNPHLAGDLATPRIALRRLQIGAVGNPRDLACRRPPPWPGPEWPH